MPIQKLLECCPKEIGLRELLHYEEKLHSWQKSRTKPDMDYISIRPVKPWEFPVRKCTNNCTAEKQNIHRYLTIQQSLGPIWAPLVGWSTALRLSTKYHCATPLLGLMHGPW